MSRTETLKKGEIIPLTFDYVFTAIFNNKDNINIIENFLACYFDIPIDKIRGNATLLPRELELESRFSRNKQVDLILDLNGEKINIELSNKIGQGIINRNVVYACNIHGRQLEYGDNNYTRIKKTIQINLNNVNTNKKLKEIYYLMTKDGKQLTEKFEIDIIDMVIGRKNCYTKDETKLDRWCLVLTSTTREEFERALEGLMEEEAKDRLVEEVDKYSSNNQVVALYSKYTKEELEHNTLLIEAKEEAEREGREEGLKRGMEQGMKEGLEQGMKEGLEQGMKEGLEQGMKEGLEQGMKEGMEKGMREGREYEKIEIAKSLKVLGTVNLDDISKVTGLPIDVICTL